jgi:hypothetical protein
MYVVELPQPLEHSWHLLCYILPKDKLGIDLVVQKRENVQEILGSRRFKLLGTDLPVIVILHEIFNQAL